MGAGPRDFVGRYQLVAPLGRGGMGEVWEAILHGPHGFEKPVALKLLRSELADDAARDALIHEARMGALLSHPNVVATHELGHHDGRWFLAMELVRGASVMALAKERPLPPGAIVDVGLHCAAALQHVHALEVGGRRAGLVHRDVKPQNLLVDRCGLVKLADLGVARLAGTPGRPSGTPGYMPPEQALGREDARSDLFALGVSLYRLVARRPPFAAPVTVEAIEASLGDPRFLEPIDAVVPGLGTVLEICLQPDPDRRWPDARALSAALREVRAALPAGASLTELLGEVRPDLKPEPSVASTAHTSVIGFVPEPRDTFVGRAAEVAEITGYVRAGHPLVTLLGPGGTGKTRLALEVARPLRAELPGGSWFVDLSGSRSGEAVLAEVASRLGLAGRPTDAAAAIGRSLAGRGRTLVVLDDAEAVVEPLSALLVAWTAAAPATTFLVTSQIALRVRGEHLYPLGPLQPADAEALFLARAVRPPSARDRDRVGDLVTRLDLMPLAIELAAARTRVMSVPMLLERLVDRFRLLAADARDVPERHRSLRASLDLSYELLPPDARAALAQLSVFAGSFTLEAAEAVVDLGPGGGWAVDAVSTLIDHSFVRVDPDGRRLSLLQSVQEYAAARLSDRREVERRHGAHYAQRGDAAALAALDRRGNAEQVRELERDAENLVAAAKRAVGREDAAVAALATVAANRVFSTRGPIARARELLTEALSLPQPLARRAELLRLLSAATRSMGDLAEAARLGDEALRIAQEAGHHREIGCAIGEQSIRAFETSRFEECQRLSEQAIGHHAKADARDAVAMGYINMGVCSWHLDALDAARELVEKGLAIGRECGIPHVEAHALGMLGVIDLNLGRFDSACAAFLEAGRIARELGQIRNEAVHRMNLAAVEEQRGQLAAAEAIYREAVSAFQTLGYVWGEASAHMHLGEVVGNLARTDEASERLERGRALALSIGDVNTAAACSAMRGDLLFALGRREDALAASDEALRTLRGPAPPMLLAGRAQVLCALGRLDEAEEAVLQGLSQVTSRQLYVQADLQGSLALVRLARGDLQGASAAAELALAAARDSRFRNTLARALCTCGEVAHARGDLAAARTAVAHAGAIARALSYGERSPLRMRIASLTAKVQAA